MVKYLSALVLLAFLGIGGVCEDATKPGPKPAARWEKLLDWLPEDTETVIVAQKSYKVPKYEPPKPGAFPEVDFGKTIRELPVGPVFGQADFAVQKELEGQTVLCVVEGSRRFRFPGSQNGLGMYRYEGCHIVVFDGTAEKALQKAFQACLDKAQKKIKLSGQQVAVFPISDERQGLWTYFVAKPKPGLLLGATDQKYLEETLKRIDQKIGKRALPKDLPEWMHVNQQANVWGVRHYSKEHADQDPTSPVKAGVAFGPDPDAVGFVFWYDRGRTMQARYLTGAQDPAEILKKGLAQSAGPQQQKINVKQVAPGVAEITAQLDDLESGSTFLFLLMFSLGHGANL